MSQRARWCGGSSPDAWPVSATALSPTGSTEMACRVPRRDGRSRTRTGSPTGGKAARCDLFWRTLATPDTQFSDGGPSRRRCSTRTTWRPGTWSGFVGPLRTGIVRSRKPAHPEIISVEDFTQAQLLRRSKSAGGLRTARKTERSARRVKQSYLFRGRIRCAICGRKMEGSPRKHAMYYRCPARTLAPGSPALATHPGAVYLREDTIRDAVNEWFAELFRRDHVDETVAALVASQDGARRKAVGRDAAEHRLTKAEAEIRRFQAAIAAGIDPMALVEVINSAQPERWRLRQRSTTHPRRT